MEPFSLVIEKEEFQYKLMAFAAHIGSTPQSGHYIAYVKESDGWICKNDNIITKVDLQDLDLSISNLSPIIWEKRLFTSSKKPPNPDGFSGYNDFVWRKP